MREDGTLIDKDSNVLDVNVSGSVPEEDSWIKVVKGQVVAYSLKFGDYVVTKLEDRDAEAVKNGTIAEDSVSKRILFANDSWADIKANLIANRNYYEIGSEKEVVIDNTSYTVRLVNTSSCPDNWPTEASRTACGVVIEFVDTIIDTDNSNAIGHVMNSTLTSAGGWPASSMYSYLNTTIFNKLPDELKPDGMIISTQTVSGHEDGVSTNYTSNDKLYLLSYVEVWGSNYDYDSVKLVDDTVLDGTRQLEYYGLLDSTKIKIYTNGSSKAWWWLRSAHSANTRNFLALDSSGSSNDYPAVATIGVAPAFRILD